MLKHLQISNSSSCLQALNLEHSLFLMLNLYVLEAIYTQLMFIVCDVISRAVKCSPTWSRAWCIRLLNIFLSDQVPTSFLIWKRQYMLDKSMPPNCDQKVYLDWKKKGYAFYLSLWFICMFISFGFFFSLWHLICKAVNL